METMTDCELAIKYAKQSAYKDVEIWVLEHENKEDVSWRDCLNFIDLLISAT